MLLSHCNLTKNLTLTSGAQQNIGSGTLSCTNSKTDRPRRRCGHRERTRRCRWRRRC